MKPADIAPTAEVLDLTRNDPAEERYRQERTAHWDEVARRWERRSGLAGAYHRRLARVYRFLVPPGQRVLELGCGQGDLLAALEPSVGVGIDFSEEMVRRAAERHPEPALPPCRRPRDRRPRRDLRRHHPLRPDQRLPGTSSACCGSSRRSPTGGRG